VRPTHSQTLPPRPSYPSQFPISVRIARGNDPELGFPPFETFMRPAPITFRFPFHSKVVIRDGCVYEYPRRSEQILDNPREVSFDNMIQPFHTDDPIELLFPAGSGGVLQGIIPGHAHIPGESRLQQWLLPNYAPISVFEQAARARSLYQPQERFLVYRIVTADTESPKYVPAHNPALFRAVKGRRGTWTWRVRSLPPQRRVSTWLCFQHDCSVDLEEVHRYGLSPPMLADRPFPAHQDPLRDSKA
jgi:hypothetical protein